jgi:hypothetical protein
VRVIAEVKDGGGKGRGKEQGLAYASRRRRVSLTAHDLVAVLDLPLLPVALEEFDGRSGKGLGREEAYPFKLSKG